MKIIGMRFQKNIILQAMLSLDLIYCPIVKLSSHDWLIDQLTPWSQQHVKDGFCEASAHWSVKTEQAGIFEISLRRWPAEADKPINDGTYGKSYNYTHARLKINGLDITKPDSY